MPRETARMSTGGRAPASVRNRRSKTSRKEQHQLSKTTSARAAPEDHVSNTDMPEGSRSAPRHRIDSSEAKRNSDLRSKFGVKAATTSLSKVPMVFSGHEIEGFEDVKCTNCIARSIPCRRTIGENECRHCKDRGFINCSFSKPGALMQYVAESSHYPTSTGSRHLAERFRNLAFTHTQMAAQQMTLELTKHNYKMAVVSLAKDLRMAVEERGDDPAKWIEAGLIESPGDLENLMEWIERALKTEEEFNGSMESAYKMHGHLLSIFQHLEDGNDVTLPKIPPPATYNTMRAPFLPAGSEDLI